MARLPRLCAISRSLSIGPVTSSAPRGARDAGLARYQEPLALCRRLVELRGLTPETLEDLVISLHQVAEVQEALGQTTAAATARAEARRLHRRFAPERADGTEPDGSGPPSN